MGTSLDGQQINVTYDALLKTSDLNGLTTTRKTIGDGFGVDSCFRLATTSAEFTNTTIFNGNIDLNANVDFTNATIIGLDYATETDLLALSGEVQTNTSNISTNTTNISTNTGNIATNTTNISTNTTDISNLTTSVNTNTSNISTNTSNISTNTTDISNLTTSVNTNTSNISTNTSNISTNTNDISALQAGTNNVISVNTFDGDITITGGTGIGVVNNAGTITLNATGTAGVTSLEGLTGALTFSGTNIDITTSGTDTIVLSASTGGGGGISWNGSTANAVGTYGSSTTIDAESKLLFDASNLDILATNATDGIRLFGGFVGVSNPVISNITGTNFSSINVDTNLILTGQHKIAFDNDLTNTYIAADLDNPENLEIHADGSVRIWADEAFEVWEPVATPSKMFSIAPDATGTQPRVTIGNNTNTDFWLDTGGLTRVRGLYYLDNVPSAGRAEGQIIFKGSTTGMTAGYIYVFDGSNWSLASVSNCTGLLGVAIGSDSAVNGMMINGIASAPTGSYTSGAVLYISDTTPGLLSTTAPSGTGEIVRRVGYGLGGITYTFTPSMEYITLA